MYFSYLFENWFSAQFKKFNFLNLLKSVSSIPNSKAPIEKSPNSRLVSWLLLQYNL